MAKSVNYLYAGFTFSSDWPEETARIAIFKMGGKAYKVLLDENNECIVPWEVLVNPGNMLVSVCSGNRITATDAKVQILQSGFTDKEITTQDPSIDVYTSLMDRMDTLDEHIAETVQNVIDNGDFRGIGIDHVVLNQDYTLTLFFTDGESYTTESIRGEQGYTPQKGIDYMTDAECEEFVDTAVEAVIEAIHDESNIYCYRGTVQTYDDLPLNPRSGDVYNVVEGYEDVAPGTNWAWNGEEWDALGGAVVIDTATDADISAMLQRLELEYVGNIAIVGDATVGESVVGSEASSLTDEAMTDESYTADD